MGTQIQPMSYAWMSAVQGLGPMAARAGENMAQGITEAGRGVTRGLNTITQKREARAKRSWMAQEHALDRALRKDMHGESLDLRKWEAQGRRDVLAASHFGDRVEGLEREAGVLRALGRFEEADAKDTEAAKWSKAQDDLIRRVSTPPVVRSNLTAQRKQQRTTRKVPT